MAEGESGAALANLVVIGIFAVKPLSVETQILVLPLFTGQYIGFETSNRVITLQRGGVQFHCPPSKTIAEAMRGP